jgi:hypothetical protein
MGYQASEHSETKSRKKSRKKKTYATMDTVVMPGFRRS